MDELKIAPPIPDTSTIGRVGQNHHQSPHQDQKKKKKKKKTGAKTVQDKVTIQALEGALDPEAGGKEDDSKRPPGTGKGDMIDITV